MHPRKVSNVYFALILAFLVLAPVLSYIPQAVEAQTPAGGSVIVYPDAQWPIYGSVGHNWTITFQARWQTDQTDEPISNATVEFKVTNAQGKPITTFDCNTSQGTFSFNYTSNVPAVLTFTPTKLVAQDKTEWIIVQPEKTLVSTCISATVYWDTYSVALVESSTGNLGGGNVSVKVTRLLLPDGGIGAYGGPKTIVITRKEVYNANVTINGVAAQETPNTGIYSANISTVFPTAYTLVTVSEDGWRTTQTAFVTTHSANLNVWLIAVSVVAASGAVFFLAFKLRSFKTNRNSKYPLAGGLFLLFGALISIYWAALGVEAIAHGFSWLPFAVLEAVCFILGIVTATFALRKKNQAAIIFSIPLLLVVNTIVEMSSLGAYGLPSPWLFVVSSILCCSASLYFVTNMDEEFVRAKKK